MIFATITARISNSLGFIPRWRQTICAVSVTLALAGCAAQRLHNEGLNQIEKGQTQQGVDNLRQASEMEPDNYRYRVDYLNQRQIQVQSLLRSAETAWRATRLDEAQQHLREVLLVDATNDRAVRGLVQIEARRRADVRVQQAEKQISASQLDAARDTLKGVLHDDPENNQAKTDLHDLEERIASERIAREEKIGSRAALRKPVTLQFRDAALRLVFEAISRATNINIVVDRDVRADLRSTIYVKDAAVEDALDLILLQNQLEKRVINSNTLLVYPATIAKQKDFNELRVRSFQLSNVDAAHMANIIKTMLKTKDVVTDVRTNTLVMRDTPEAIAVAEQLIAANDSPDPEVMLEVEVLEITTQRNYDIGAKWPTSFTLSTPTDVTTLGTLGALRGGRLLASQLSLALNLQLTDSDINTLSSPRIRARNKEKAKVMVGDKVPVITNVLASAGTTGTATTAGTNAANNYITGSIQYLDVGLKLEVEPQVYAEGDVGIKINLEVSTIANTITTQSGTAYQIGTRNVQTSLRLKDGETQILAGLISKLDSNSSSKVPGLGQFPILGHLFSDDSGKKQKQEIVLSITPHIIRPLATPDIGSADLFVGSDAAVRSRPLRVDPIETLRLNSGQGGAQPALPMPAFPLPSIATPPATPALMPASIPPSAVTPMNGPASGSTIPVPTSLTPAFVPVQKTPKPAALTVAPAGQVPMPIGSPGMPRTPPAPIVPQTQEVPSTPQQSLPADQPAVNGSDGPAEVPPNNPSQQLPNQ